MQFNLEAILSVGLCLTILISSLIRVIPLEKACRDQAGKLIRVVVEESKDQLLYQAKQSSDQLPYQASSGQKLVEFMSLILDLKQNTAGAFDHAAK